MTQDERTSWSLNPHPEYGHQPTKPKQKLTALYMFSVSCVSGKSERHYVTSLTIATRVVKISRQPAHFTGYFEYCSGYSEC